MIVEHENAGSVDGESGGPSSGKWLGPKGKAPYVSPVRVVPGITGVQTSACGLEKFDLQVALAFLGEEALVRQGRTV